MMKTMKPSAFARHLNVSPGYVSNLKKTGRLVLASNGEIQVDASLWRIEGTRGGERPPPSEPLPLANWIHPALDFQLARARREKANADLAEREARARAAGLMLVDTIEDAVTEAVAIIRAALAIIPASLASQIALSTDENQIRYLLEDKINAALEDIATQLAEQA